MIFENGATKDITFLDEPAELDTSNIIWIGNTNLMQLEFDINDHVWLWNLTNDDKHYAVVVDIGNCWWHWDGTIVAKKNVIILKEEE